MVEDYEAAPTLHPGVTLLRGIPLRKPIKVYCGRGSCMTPFELTTLDGVKRDDNDRYYVICPSCGGRVLITSPEAVEIISDAFLSIG